MNNLSLFAQRVFEKKTEYLRSDFLSLNKTAVCENGNLFVFTSSSPSYDVRKVEEIVTRICVTNPENIVRASLLLVPTYRASFPNLPYMDKDPNRFYGLSFGGEINHMYTILDETLHSDSRAGTETSSFGVPPELSEHVSPLVLTGQESLDHLLSIPNVSLLSSTTPEIAHLMQPNLSKTFQGEPILPVYFSTDLHLLFTNKLHMQIVLHIQKKNPALPFQVHYRVAHHAKDLYHFDEKKNNTFNFFDHMPYCVLPALNLIKAIEVDVGVTHRPIVPSFTNTPLRTVCLKTNRPVTRATVKEARTGLELSFLPLHEHDIEAVRKYAAREPKHYYYYLDNGFEFGRAEEACVFLSPDNTIDIEWTDPHWSPESYATLTYLVHDGFFWLKSVEGDEIACLSCANNFAYLSQKVGKVWQQKLAECTTLLTLEEYKHLYYTTLAEVGAETSFKENQHWSLHFEALDAKILFLTDFNSYQSAYLQRQIRELHADRLAPFSEEHTYTNTLDDTRYSDLFTFLDEQYPDFSRTAIMCAMDEVLESMFPSSLPEGDNLMLLAPPYARFIRESGNHFGATSGPRMMTIFETAPEPPPPASDTPEIDRSRFLKFFDKVHIDHMYYFVRAYELLTIKLVSLPSDAVCCFSLEKIGFGHLFYKCNRCSAVSSRHLMSVWMCTSKWAAASCRQCREEITELPQLCWNLPSWLQTPLRVAVMTAFLQVVNPFPFLSWKMNLLASTVLVKGGEIVHSW